MTKQNTEEEANCLVSINKSSAVTKNRLLLTTNNKHPLMVLQTKLKDRGLKNLDIGMILLEAADFAPENWWKEKLEELTPLEYKIQQALENPHMRKRLSELVAECTRE